MARAEIVVQSGLAAGVTGDYHSANADGNKFDNDGHTIIHVLNGSATELALTVQTPFSMDGLALAEGGGVVAAFTEKFFGPFAPETYNHTTGVDAGKVYVDCDDEAAITIAVLKV